MSKILSDQQLDMLETKVGVVLYEYAWTTDILSCIRELMELRRIHKQYSAVVQDKIEEAGINAKRTYSLMSGDGWRMGKRYSAPAPVTKLVNRSKNWSGRDRMCVIEYVEIEHKRYTPQEWLDRNKKK